jgi:DNA recombination protein RmuC
MMIVLVFLSVLTLVVCGLVWSRMAKVQGLADEVRTELRGGREESRIGARELREELSGVVRALGLDVRRAIGDAAEHQRADLEGMTKELKGLTVSQATALEGVRETLESRVQSLQQANEGKLDAVRKELSEGLNAHREAVAQAVGRLSEAQQSALKSVTDQVSALSEANQTTLERIRSTVDGRVKDLQDSNDRARDGLRTALEAAAQAQAQGLESVTVQLNELSTTNRDGLNEIRTSLDVRVQAMQASNEGKLDEMRRVVEDKLQSTLEKRLGESFKLVSERLEAVHQGLGEMQNLASGVGDLKRVLTNVRTRGTWAEYQLGAILDHLLTSDQYARNVAVREGSLERVEFAIRLPGPKDEPGRTTWLPIDSKFLKEDYLRLQAAAEAGDAAAVQQASEALARALRAAAKEIHAKYVCPPYTTDFALMFLATEGLFAEALRHPNLIDEIQQKYRVMLAGPTTLAAILSSLRMGFQTLVVEQRATEVWRVLGAVKTEFGKFGGVLERLQRQLQSASRTIDETGTRTRAMERRLRTVEQLSPTESARILTMPGVVGRSVHEERDVEDGGDFGTLAPSDAPHVGDERL